MKAFKTLSHRRAIMLSGVGVGALALAMLSTSAFAQSQDATPPAATPAAPTTNEVVVTGVRASVGSALTLQRTATQLQDSIVAEDIGKLPDNNVVEALQHVSGISILRNSVEPSTVLIRGLPDIATTLNGRDIFTSSGNFISLPDLPAELLAKVDVKKSASADDIEGGIAGLIDVTLHRPFDFNTPQLAGGFKETYGTLSQKTAPDGSFLASDRWMTGIGEIGALIDVSYQDKEAEAQTINQITQLVLRRTVPGVTATGPAGTSPGSAAVAAGQIATPSTTTFGEAPTKIVRSAINGSVQWRPNDTMEFYTDYFFTRLRNEAPNQVNVFLLGTSPDAADSQPFAGTNVGQILPSGGYGLTSIQDRHSAEDTYQIASGGKWDVTDHFKLNGEFDYTHTQSQTTAYIVDAQYNYGAQGVTLLYNTTGNGGVIANQPTQQQVLGTTYIDQFYDQHNPIASGHEYAFRLNGNYWISDDRFLRSVDVGYRFADHAAVSDATAGSGLNCALTSGNGSLSYNAYLLDAINSPACTAFRANSGPLVNGAATNYVGGISYASLGPGAYSVTNGSFFNGIFGTSNWATLSPGWIRNNLAEVRSLFGYSGQPFYIPTNHFDVDERSNAAFAKANYAFDAFDIPIDGNFGLRIVQTALTENGFTSKYVPLNPAVGPTVAPNSNCTTCVVYTPSHASKTDTQILPSFNLRAQLVHGLFLRAAFSDTVTRPTFTQLNPGLTLSAPTATLLGTASGGNSSLVPEKSRNYDLDLTYYWGKANHFSVATFYRTVTGYIENGQSNLVVSGQNYIYTAPINFPTADIKGTEVGYSQFLDFLPGLWSGFGWDVNATQISAPFNNVAPYHVNVAGIYEKGPYSFRVSYTWNSQYLVGAFATGAQPQFTYAAPQTNVDLSANYRLNQHLTFTFDATNLLDSWYRQYAGQGSYNEQIYPTGISRYGRTFALGARFKW